MNTAIALQEIELWEAWVEFEHHNSAGFGTLYLLGEANLESRSTKTNFTKVNGYAENTLVLRLPEISKEKRNKVKEVLYSEPVQSITPYNRIIIFQGEEIIAEINEIEVLV